MSDRLLLLFAKTVRPGEVKTRLVGERDAFEVSRLYEAFLVDLLARLSQGEFDLRVLWAAAPGEALPELTGVEAYRQRGADLGERLHRGLVEAAAAAPCLAVVGSDHPDLPLERIHQGFAAIEDGADLALGPTPDGGYYMLALRREALSERLFAEIPWSHESVARTTLDRCREQGLRVALLPPEADVDRPEDVPRLASRLGIAGRGAPQTAAVLSEWGVDPCAS